MNEKPLVIWNPSAGRTAELSAFRDDLSRATSIQLAATASRSDADRMIREAVARGCRRVIAAGGDGTVNVVVQTLAELEREDVSLAVLPLGTGNDLARALAMPLNIQAAIPVCLRPANHHLDVFHCRGNAESRVIANMCTCGNTGVYLQNLTPEVKERWGPLCYLRGVVDVLGDLRTFDVRIAWDGQPAGTYKLLNLFLANGRTTGAGLTVADGAELDDRRLEVVAVLDGPATEIASLAADYLLSDFLHHPLVIHRSACRLTVEATGSFPVTIDGDVFTDQPIQVECADRQIPVVRGDGDD